MVEENYASKGVAGTGLGLGIAGTALALLQNGNGLGGLFGNNNATLLATNALAEKDAKIARLESQQYADRNTIELYKYVDAQFSAITNTLATLTCQVNRNTAVLGEITKIGVPNTALVPGVPAVTITNTPTTAATTQG